MTVVQLNAPWAFEATSVHLIEPTDRIGLDPDITTRAEVTRGPTNVLCYVMLCMLSCYGTISTADFFYSAWCMLCSSSTSALCCCDPRPIAVNLTC